MLVQCSNQIANRAPAKRSVCDSLIRSAIAGFEVQSANPYTTRPHGNGTHIARGTGWAYTILTSEVEQWLRGSRYNETTATLCKRQRELQDRLLQHYCFAVPLSRSMCYRGVTHYYW